jgi:hypothetical protein
LRPKAAAARIPQGPGSLMPSLAAIALVEYERRLASARRKVADGAIEPREADALLRPWLALACRSGADRAEYDDALAELRVIPAEEGKLFFDDSSARAAVADDICPLPAIRAALASARDQAIERATDAEGLDLARNDRAGGLVALAIAFGAPPYRPKPRTRRQEEIAA